MKRIYISENEKKEILSKYRLNETVQTQTQYSVGDLQNKLISLGFNPGKADNMFGPNTLAAIEKALGVGTSTPQATGQTPQQTTPQQTTPPTMAATTQNTTNTPIEI